MASIKDREIFKIGKWRGNQVVEADAAYLAHMVQSYAELNSKVPGFAVPVKLGHNKKIGEPAFGYAENVRLSDDGSTVLADFNDVPPEIVDAITEKKYNTVSVEIWPTVTFGGKTYTNVLSGVALLGAEWPAVKGLKPLSMFSGEEAAIQLSQEEDDVTKTFSEADHDTLMAAAVATAVLAEQAKTTAAEQRAVTAEAALASFTDEAEKKAVAAVITAAEAKGQIVPANKASVVAMAEALRLSVEPAKRTAALATFTAFVEALPKKVDFKEAGASDQTVDTAGATAGEKVDTAVKAAMKADTKLTYRTALDAVFAAQPDLKTAYAEENR